MSSSNNTSSNTNKQKSKQKKSEEVIELQHRMEQLIRENLELSITVKKLNDRTIQMKSLETVHMERHKLSAQQVEDQLEKLQLMNMAKDEHIKTLRQQKEQFQIQNGCINYKLQRLKKEFDEYRIVSQQQYDQLKRQSEQQLKNYQTVVSQYQVAINERLEYLSNNNHLQSELESTKEQHKRVVADKDRDKLQTIDYLKKQMHQKTKEMKANLLSMRRQQMATNTRLTVLQNHQLLEELEYQSKHTQKILKRNQELEKKVIELTKQLEVEKDVIEQLAKRSTIAKKIIKNINEKNISLEKQLQELMQNDGKTSGAINRNNKSKSKNRSSEKGQAGESSLSSQSYLTTIKLLESQITSYQNRLKKSDQLKAHFQNLYESNHPKYEYYLKAQEDLRLLMIRFLSSILEGKVIGEENSVEYDISRLKNIHVNDWTKSDVEITVKMLLTFIQPYFTMKHMKTHFLKSKQWNNVQKDSIDELLMEDQANNIEQSDLKSQQYNYLNTRKDRPKGANNKMMKSFSGSHLKNRNLSLNNNDKSVNISPEKGKQAQFSLHAVLQDYKNKESARKIKKCQSQHVFGSLHSTNNQPNNKFISGHEQQSSFKPYQIKQNYNNSQSQNSLVNGNTATQQLQKFNNSGNNKSSKNKESKKLLKTNIRDWGKKINMHSQASLFVGNK